MIILKSLYMDAVNRRRIPIGRRQSAKASLPALTLRLIITHIYDLIQIYEGALVVIQEYSVNNISIFSP